MKSLLIFIVIGIPVWSISQNDTTTLATTMFTEISGEGNVIYCSNMELLCLEFTDYIGEQPVSEELHLEINNLNKVSKEYEFPLDEKYWFAEVGLVSKGIVDSIANNYQSQFGISWIPPGYGTNKLIGHSYLNKKIDFYARLNDDFNHFYFKDSTHAKCFGLDEGWGNPTYRK